MISMIKHTYLLSMKRVKHVDMGTCHGTTSLGERGQVVIPKKARTKLGLTKGDNFLVIEKGPVIVLIPVSAAETMIADFTEGLKKVTT